MLHLPWPKRLASWFQPRLLVRSHSALNPVLEVVEDSGRRLLNSSTANYSYGSLYDAFAKAFAHFQINEHPINEVLILGFGAGSIAHLLAHTPPPHVVGVEYDAEVIRLYHEFFPQLPEVELIEADAQAFLESDSRRFDLILVDVFIDRTTPPHLLQPAFLNLLSGHLRPAGIILFNRIEESDDYATVRKFSEAFAATFGRRRIFRTALNTFYANQ